MGDSGLRSLLTRPVGTRRLVELDTAAALLYVLVLLPIALPWEAGAWVVVAGGLPLAVRRLWPVPVFAAVAAATLTGVALGVAEDNFAAAAYALYPVALARPRRRWLPTPLIGGVSALTLCFLAVTGAQSMDRRVGDVLFGLALLGGTWTVGRAVRERRAHAAHTVRELADRAAADERLRIARELHDVVAHNMSLIAVKAGVADHVADARPQEAREALRVIADTSRSALTEMRHLLGVLRAEPDLAPAPGPGGLAALAERAALAGVKVELDVRAGDLPEGVALSVYRIVQEALTNVVKHAAPARCLVRVADDGGAVRVEVADDGPGARTLPGPAGHGLIGMRERVMMYGGDFTAGPRSGGDGFAVSARLPYGR
ncbi:sensor histidine kinase [Spirillospora sp. NPDC050679]